MTRYVSMKYLIFGGIWYGACVSFHIHFKSQFSPFYTTIINSSLCTIFESIHTSNFPHTTLILSAAMIDVWLWCNPCTMGMGKSSRKAWPLEQLLPVIRHPTFISEWKCSIKIGFGEFYPALWGFIGIQVQDIAFSPHRAICNLSVIIWRTPLPSFW